MQRRKPAPLDWSQWVPLQEALFRIRDTVGSLKLAVHELNEDLLTGRLKSALRQISCDGEEPWRLLKSSDWRQRRVRYEDGLKIELPSDRYANVTCIGDASLQGHYYIVRRADLDKHYPIAATSTMTAAHRSDDTRPPERRRGPTLKHEWHAIDGEIARRCINPKTRLLQIPKNERKLAEDVLEWCQENYQKEPVQSEMRDAVKAICAALRAVYK
jgi:hypothetical protein